MNPQQHSEDEQFDLAFYNWLLNNGIKPHHMNIDSKGESIVDCHVDFGKLKKAIKHREQRLIKEAELKARIETNVYYYENISKINGFIDKKLFTKKINELEVELKALQEPKK